jgi:3-methylcrotonyl-CoA carboxylase beta subunit
MPLLRTSSTRLRGVRLHKPTLRALIATHTPRVAETLFAQVKSNVDTSSPDFKINAAQMKELTGSLRSLHQQIALGGPEKARQKHIERKKMLPREYVAAAAHFWSF